MAVDWGRVCAFPGLRARSRGEWEQNRERERPLVDARYRLELEMIGGGLPMSEPGVCAFCSHITVFSSDDEGAQLLTSGVAVPDWGQQQSCGCDLALTCSARAIAHYIAVLLGPLVNRSIGICGDRWGIGHLLASRGARIKNLESSALIKLDTTHAREYALFDVIICADMFDRVENLSALLETIRKTLIIGGAMLFTTPFHIQVDESRFTPGDGNPAELRWRFGWDLLERVRAVGFRDCAALGYWSRELGYLGVNNLLFAARK